MKGAPMCVAIALGMGLLAGSLQAAPDVKHVFLAVDNGKGELRYVNQPDPSKNWTVKTAAKPRDLRLSEDGKRVLLSVNDGAIEYEITTGKETGFKISGHTGIQSAQKLEDGNYLLATGGSIILCDKNGRALRKIPTVKGGSRPYIRLLTVTKDNTILYSAANPKSVIEIDFEGRLLKQIKLPQTGYKAIKLENGNILSSTGDTGAVLELNDRNQIVRTLGGVKNFPELALTFCSGWSRLKNGNVVATSWHGHGYKGKGPHLIAYTPDNRVVWTWSHAEVKQITNVLVIE